MRLYRIVQEMVENAVRHVSAKNIRIYLFRDERLVKLELKDDGKGMKPIVDPGKGIGLRIIRERTESLRGRFTIDSRPHEGTVVCIEIPLEPAIVA